MNVTQKFFLFVITISVLILDVVLTNIFSLYTSILHSESNILISQSTLGVKNEIYHYDVIKNGSVENEYPKQGNKLIAKKFLEEYFPERRSQKN